LSVGYHPPHGEVSHGAFPIVGSNGFGSTHPPTDECKLVHGLTPRKCSVDSSSNSTVSSAAKSSSAPTHG
jgi:hypothetical protein